MIIITCMYIYENMGFNEKQYEIKYCMVSRTIITFKINMYNSKITIRL